MSPGWSDHFHKCSRRIGYQFRLVAKRGACDDILEPIAIIMNEIRKATSPTSSDSLFEAVEKAPTETQDLFGILAQIAARPPRSAHRDCRRDRPTPQRAPTPKPPTANEARTAHYETPTAAADTPHPASP